MERDTQVMDEARQKGRPRGGDSTHPHTCPVSPAASEGKSMEDEDEGTEVRAGILAPRAQLGVEKGGFVFLGLLGSAS